MLPIGRIYNSVVAKRFVKHRLRLHTNHPLEVSLGSDDMPRKYFRRGQIQTILPQKGSNMRQGFKNLIYTDS